MLKRMVLVLATLFLAAGTSVAAESDSRQGKTELSVNYEHLFYSESALDDSDAVVARWMYGVGPEWLLGVEAGWIFEKQVNSRTPDDGGLSGLPVMAMAEYRFSTEHEAKPYLLGGLGIIQWYDSNTTDSGATVNLDGGTAFAGKVGAGVDWVLQKNWALSFEGGYTFSTDAVDVTLNSSKNTPGLGYFYLGGGLKYLFD